MTGVVVYVTSVFGGAAVIAPDRVGDLLGGRDDLGLRLIGVADLVIAGGLLFARRRSRWLLARAVANPPTAARFMRLGRANGSRVATVAGYALCAATLADLKTARDLARGE